MQAGGSVSAPHLKDGIHILPFVMRSESPLGWLLITQGRAALLRCIGVSRQSRRAEGPKGAHRHVIYAAANLASCD